MDRIIIRRKHGRYFACYEGPHAKRMLRIFGVNEFPIAYSADAPAQYVLKNIQHHNGCRVVLSAKLQLEANHG